MTVEETVTPGERQPRRRPRKGRLAFDLQVRSAFVRDHRSVALNFGFSWYQVQAAGHSKAAVPMYHRCMSRSLGPQLPAPILNSLSAEPHKCGGRAILIATTDSSGRPHPALLTYGEVLAEGPATLRLAAYAGSATAENLRVRGAVTLCLVEPGAAHYVKARAHELMSPLPGRAIFEATVEDVRADEADPSLEDAAEIATGITFHTKNLTRRAEADQAIREALRAAGR